MMSLNSCQIWKGDIFSETNKKKWQHRKWDDESTKNDSY